MKYAFAGFCQQIFGKDISEGILDKIDKMLQRMISADIRTDVKQEIKELAVSYNFSLKYLLKTWNTM